ncbi:MAG: hypothetical protein JRH11_07865 [Deltaproteobacteria bacterium]|nr:hypothetical protein [Deltaproteobacteria bacterium]
MDSTNDPPFPFVGAGDVHYQERASVQFVLTRAPSPDELAFINECCPTVFEGLNPVSNWGRVLMALRTDHHLLAAIQAAHDPKLSLDEQMALADDDTFEPSAPARRAFNDSIGGWLRAVHTRVPIALALRWPDEEAAQSPSFDEWHGASGRAVLELFARWARDGFWYREDSSEERFVWEIVGRVLRLYALEDHEVPSGFTDLLYRGYSGPLPPPV